MKIKGIIKKEFFLLIGNWRLFFKLLIMRFGFKFLKYLFLPKSSVQKRINGILFEFNFNLDPKIEEMYFNYYEPEVVEIMKMVLKPGDIFIDVGASIGYLSAVGAGFIGKDGQVHSFEPVPQYFQQLKNMAENNPDYKIIVNQCALGEKEEIANIDLTNLSNIGWNTMVQDRMKDEIRKETLKVPVYRLDAYIKQKEISRISLIKIDVEGFESSVLKGLSNYFQNTNYRPVIICEIVKSAYPALKYTLTQLIEYMKKYNYSTYSIVNFNKKINIKELKDIDLVVFKPLV